MVFDIEQQYQLYLKKVGLDEPRMGEIQKKETKQAFAAGVSQTALYYFQLASLKEDDAVEKLDALMKQITAFWNGL